MAKYEGLEKSPKPTTKSSGLADRAESAFNDFVDAMQVGSSNDLSAFVGGDFNPNMPEVMPGSHLVGKARKALGLGPSAADVVLARGLQSGNPFVPESAFDSPAMERAGMKYANLPGADYWGPPLQAAAQVPAQLAQSLALAPLAMEKGVGQLANAAFKTPAVRGAVKAGYSALANQAMAAAQAPLGAERGERGSAFMDTLTDPKLAAVGLLGGGLHPISEHLTARRAAAAEAAAHRANYANRLEQLAAMEAPPPPSEVTLRYDQSALPTQSAFAPTDFSLRRAKQPTMMDAQLHNDTREYRSAAEPLTERGTPVVKKGVQQFEGNRPAFLDRAAMAKESAINEMAAEAPTLPDWEGMMPSERRRYEAARNEANRAARNGAPAGEMPTSPMPGRGYNYADESGRQVSAEPVRGLSNGPTRVENINKVVSRDEPTAELPHPLISSTVNMEAPWEKTKTQWLPLPVKGLPGEFIDVPSRDLLTGQHRAMSVMRVQGGAGKKPGNVGSMRENLRYGQEELPGAQTKVERFFPGESGERTNPGRFIGDRARTEVMEAVPNPKTQTSFRMQGLQDMRRQVEAQSGVLAHEPATQSVFLGPELPPEPKAGMARNGAPDPRAMQKQVTAPPVEGGFPLPDRAPVVELALQLDAAKQLYKAPSVLENLRRELGLPENRADNRGAVESAQAIRSLHAARRMGEVALEEVFPRLQKELDGLDPSARKDVKRVIMSIRDNGVGDLSKLPEGYRGLFDKLQGQMAHYRLYLAKAGYFTPRELETLARNAEQGRIWLTRDYQRFVDGKWAPPKDVQARVAERLVEEARKQKVEGYSLEDAYADVRAMLKDSPGDVRTPEQRMGNAGIFKKGVLKQRVLPEWLRPLFGVIDDPSFILSASAGELGRMFHVYKVTQAMTAPEFEGKVWSRKYTSGMDERVVGQDLEPVQAKRLYGEFAGKYVTPELYEALHETPPQATRNMAWQLSQLLTDVFRTGKVLLSPITFARNWTANAMYAGVSGMPALKQWKYLGRALQVMSDYSKSTLRENAGTPAEWMSKAMEDGAVRPGRGAEFGGGEARYIINNLLKENGKGPMGGLRWLMQQGAKAKKNLGSMYELLDGHWRLATYLYHVEQGLKSGLSERSARTRASSLVNRYFASGASVSPIVKDVSRKSFGLAPFLSWHVDNARVAKNIMADAAKGNFAPVLRAGLWWSVPVGLSMTTRYATGLPDEAVEQGEVNLRKGWREDNPVRDWAPFLDGKGRPVAMSFDAINPFTVFLKGSAESPVPARIAANLLAGTVESGWLQPGVDSLLEKGGLRDPKYTRQQLPGEEGYALAKQLAEYYQPAMVQQFKDAVRRTQEDNLRPGEELHSPLQAALRAVSPVRFDPVGERSMAQRMKQERVEGRELGRVNPKVIGARFATGAVDNAEAKRLLERSRQKLEALRAKQGARR